MSLFQPSDKENLFKTILQGNSKGTVSTDFSTGVILIPLEKRTLIKNSTVMVKIPLDTSGKNGFKSFDYGLAFVDILDSEIKEIDSSPNFEPNAYMLFFNESELLTDNRILSFNFDIDLGFKIQFKKHKALEIRKTQPFLPTENLDPIIEDPDLLVPLFPNQTDTISNSGESFLPLVKLNLPAFNQSYDSIQDSDNYLVTKEGTDYYVNLGNIYSLITDRDGFNFVSDNILKNFNVDPNGILSLPPGTSGLNFQFIPVPHNIPSNPNTPVIDSVKDEFTASGNSENSTNHLTLGVKSKIENNNKISYLNAKSNLRLSNGGTLGDYLKITLLLFDEEQTRISSIPDPWPIGEVLGPHSQISNWAYETNSQTTDREIYLEIANTDGLGRPILLNIWVKDSSCDNAETSSSNLISGGEIFSGKVSNEMISNSFSLISSDNDNYLKKDISNDSFLGNMINFYIASILKSSYTTSYRKLLDFQFKDFCEIGPLDIGASFHLQYINESITYDANKNPGDPKGYTLSGRWGKFIVRLSWN